MASTKEYLTFILDQLSGLEEIAYKPMMGEYILYYQGIIIGGIYDDRFLIKRTEAAERIIGDIELVSPYPGAKEMILVNQLDRRDILEELLEAMISEPERPKKK